MIMISSFHDIQRNSQLEVNLVCPSYHTKILTYWEYQAHKSDVQIKLFISVLQNIDRAIRFSLFTISRESIVSDVGKNWRPIFR